METLTVKTLGAAIVKSIGENMMSKIEAEGMAQHILNFFGYSERIIDNVLHPEDRDLFYMMEDNGLMVTAREETTLFDGRDWRIHYWLFKKGKILDMAKPAEISHEENEELKMNDIYNSIPMDAWKRI